MTKLVHYMVWDSLADSPSDKFYVHKVQGKAFSIIVSSTSYLGSFRPVKLFDLTGTK